MISGHTPKNGTSLPTDKYCYATDKVTSGMNIVAVQALYDAAE